MVLEGKNKEGKYTWFREVRGGGATHTSRLTIGVPALKLDISSDVSLYGFGEGQIFGATTHKIVKTKDGGGKELKSYTVVLVKHRAEEVTNVYKTYPGCVVLLEAKGEEDINLVSSALSMMSTEDINNPLSYEAIRILIDGFKVADGKDRARYISEVLGESLARAEI